LAPASASVDPSGTTAVPTTSTSTTVAGGGGGAGATTWDLPVGFVPMEQWQAVTYGDGTFLAVGDSGNGTRAMSSDDGYTWTTQTSPGNNWRSVAHGGGLFVAVAGNGTGNRVMTSPDGS
jgi:hypothetical protein